MGVSQLWSSEAIFCFKITGTLTIAEFKQLQAAAVAGIANQRKVNILVILEDFLGWEKGPGWDDTSFSSEHDQNIEKMAIVGPEQWRDLVNAFVGKGLRPVIIDYFLPSQLEMVKKWISTEI
jgi:hypothetical protein